MDSAPVILVVDDEPDIVESLDFALRRKGYEVRVAYDGESALESARHDPPRRSDDLGQIQCRVARSAADVEQRLADGEPRAAPCAS